MCCCRSLSIAFLCVLMIPFVCPAAEWNLVWNDEFDGPQIDTSKWTHEVNGRGGGNNELQYYTDRPQNSFIENGHLVIRAIKEVYTGADGTRYYTSARLNTRYKGDWLYGRIEARAQVPAGQGLWPAIWMLPTDWEYGGWAASGEIDVMEYRGDLLNRIYGTIHFGDVWPGNTQSGSTYEGPDYSQDFYTFALEWDPGQFRWYVDGTLFFTESSWWSSAAAYPAPFNKRFHLLVNMAVGGAFLPDPPPDADYFPRDFRIDYVRVYQKSTLQDPYSGVPILFPARIEAEDFDLGGAETAYRDEEPTNFGGQYRPDDGVDIEPTTDDGGGYNVGWVRNGEWMEYSVQVDQPGRYRFETRVASLNQTGQFRLRLLGENDSIDLGAVSFPPTGGWQTWTTVNAGEATLSSGNYILRFEAEAMEFNVNYFEAFLEEPINSVSAWILF